MQNLKRDNERKFAELKSRIARERIQKQQDETQALTGQEVSIVKSEEQRNVLITQVDGERKIAENKIKARVVEQVNQARAATNKLMKETD